MSFQIPEHVRPIRDAVLSFIEEEVYPVEKLLEERGTDESRQVMSGLMQEAKQRGLWALGHPEEIGGGGLPFLAFAEMNEVIGRSHVGQMAVGSVSRTARRWKRSARSSSAAARAGCSWPARAHRRR